MSQMWVSCNSACHRTRTPVPATFSHLQGLVYSSHPTRGDLLGLTALGWETTGGGMISKAELLKGWAASVGPALVRNDIPPSKYLQGSCGTLGFEECSYEAPFGPGDLAVTPCPSGCSSRLHANQRAALRQAPQVPGLSGVTGMGARVGLGVTCCSESGCRPHTSLNSHMWPPLSLATAVSLSPQ